MSSFRFKSSGSSCFEPGWGPGPWGGRGLCADLDFSWPPLLGSQKEGKAAPGRWLGVPGSRIARHNLSTRQKLSSTAPAWLL